MSDEFHKRGGFWVRRRRRWLLHNPNWAGRHPSVFRKENVYVQNGALVLKSQEEVIGHIWGTAFVRTKAKRQYGYYEIKCKMMDSAISSAFWFAHNRDFEIDVFEYSTSKNIPNSGGQFSNLFMMNTHVFTEEERKKEKKDDDNKENVDVGRDLSKEIVKVGLFWIKRWIVWYLNDVEVRRIENRDIHRELHLQLDSDLFEDWFRYPAPGNLPNQFEIYYVRSWRMVNN